MNTPQSADEVGLLSSEEVAQRLKIHWKALMRLVEAGVLRPQRLGGSRNAAAWSARDLQEAYVAANLRRSGVPVARVARVLEMLRAETRDPYSGRYDLLLYDAGEDAEDGGELVERPEWGMRLDEIREEAQRRNPAGHSFSIIPLEMPYTVRTGLPLILPPDAPRPGISTVGRAARNDADTGGLFQAAA